MMYDSAQKSMFTELRKGPARELQVAALQVGEAALQVRSR